jgi:hypothetical protein
MLVNILTVSGFRIGKYDVLYEDIIRYGTIGILVVC